MKHNDKLEIIKNQFNSDERVDEMLASYALTSETKGIEVDPFEPIREDLIYNLAVESANKGLVLDIGCGIGHLVNRLTNAEIECVGFDCAERMIELAKAHLQNAV